MMETPRQVQDGQPCAVFVTAGWEGPHLHMARCTGTWMHWGEYPVKHVATHCDGCGKELERA